MTAEMTGSRNRPEPAGNHPEFQLGNISQVNAKKIKVDGKQFAARLAEGCFDHIQILRANERSQIELVIPSIGKAVSRRFDPTVGQSLCSQFTASAMVLIADASNPIIYFRG